MNIQRLFQLSIVVFLLTLSFKLAIGGLLINVKHIHEYVPVVPTYDYYTPDGKRYEPKGYSDPAPRSQPEPKGRNSNEVTPPAEPTPAPNSKGGVSYNSYPSRKLLPDSIHPRDAKMFRSDSEGFGKVYPSDVIIYSLGAPTATTLSEIPKQFQPLP